MKIADAICSDIFEELHDFDVLSKALDSMSSTHNMDLFNDMKKRVNKRLQDSGATFSQPITLFDF